MQPRRPDTQDPLMLAARYNDADSEERGITDTLTALGLDAEHVMYVAEQRAIRSVMIASGRIKELQQMTATTNLTPVKLSREERRQFVTLIALYLDGIALGWRARMIRDNVESEATDGE